MEDHSFDLVKATKEVVGVDVKNSKKEDLGEIHEVMLEKISGKVAYVVLESGSFLGLGGKLFAIPWNAIHYDKNEECFILDIDKEKLKSTEGFDKDNWPNMADKKWHENISKYYGVKSYWDI